MEIEKGKHYLMPVSIGPVPGQTVSRYDEITNILVQYLTERDALARLLPGAFEVPDEPLVTVFYAKCRKVDFMPAGYNILGINLSTHFNGKKDQITGDYAFMLWESDVFPIALGREIFGVPKAPAEIPDPEQVGDDWKGEVKDAGRVLVEVFVRNAQEAPPEVLQFMQQITEAGAWMTWKYIPSVNWQDADVSCPVLVPTRTTIHKAYTGEPEVRFHQIPFELAQRSSQVMEVLATLPVKEYRAGVVNQVTQDLVVGEARRLE